MDNIIQALSGIMLATGGPQDPPVRIGIPTADTLTPLFGVIGILSVLEQRHRSGLGQYIDVSMLGTLTSVVAAEPFDVLERLGIPMRTGPTVPRLAPFGEVPSAAGDPARLSAIPRAGFNLATIAGNHAYDQAPNGVRDTMGTLRALGVPTAGTGMNLAEARTPATIDRCGLRVALLSYKEYATPGGPGRIYTFVEPDSLEAMERDIEDLRAHCDALVVSFHKGVGHTRATVASAEKHLTHAAVNAGADVVLGHYAHICKGIEVYRGKPIYHGLGNFVTPGRSLSIDPKENQSPERLLWAKRRRQIFGFEPDPSMPNYAFIPSRVTR
jgi:hypothetical protein